MSGRSVNVTSLTPHLPYITSFDVDFMALQEVRLTIDGQKIIDDSLVPLGWQAIWGNPQPIRKGTTKSITDAKQGGVGVLVRTKHQVAPSPRTDAGEELFKTGRWQSCVIKLNRSSSLLHVVTVYGYPGANDGGEEMEKNEEFLTNVFLEAASLGNVPVVIGGDFNVSLENSLTLSRFVSSGIWSDAASLYSMATGEPMIDTYKTTVGTSRIDMLFMNAAATRTFKAFNVIEVPPDGIKRHKPVEGRWLFDMPKEYAMKIQSARGLPKRRTEMNPEEIKLIAHEAVVEFGNNFYEAFFENDVDMMWEAWCSMAESYLVTKAAIESGQPEIIDDKRYYGRGRTREKRTRVGRECENTDGVQPQEERRSMQKLVNLLQEIKHLIELGRNAEVTPLWKKACRLGPECIKKRAWNPNYVPDIESLYTIIAEAKKVLHKVTWGDRERQIRSWRNRKLDLAKAGIGDLSRHFRGADQSRLTVLKKPNGEITGRICEIDELLRENWLPIFAKHSHGLQPTPNTEKFLEEYEHLIPEYRQVLEDITLKDVRWAIARLTTEGAGGLDGWRPKELKQIPDSILDFLVVMYNKIEEVGVWPQEICTAGVSLIPKGEGGAPLDQRPITVSATIYRVWAAIRMRDSIPWQEQWMKKGQHGARAKHSTIDALMRVSLFFEQAIQAKTPAYGIAIDLSKAFDNIPIDITFAVCQKLGMDKKLFDALKGMYSQIKRRFKIGEFVGQCFKDTNGILQGCPLSVMLLNALMAVLSAKLETTLLAESFVDDLTILHSSQEVLQDGMDAIAKFVDATAQVVNLKKTKTFGPNGGATIQYKGALVPESGAVKILGIIWKFKAGNLDLQVDPEKISGAIALAHRIRYAGLPFQLRNILNCSLVMSKILYAIEIVDLPLADERKLRTAVGYSIWPKSSKQRSPGLLFTLPCKGHVVDPTQAPHVRRLVALRRCLNNDEDVKARVFQILGEMHQRRTRSGGFVENLMYTLKRLNLEMMVADSDIIINFPGKTLSMTESEASTWEHFSRESARRAVWRSIDHERVRDGRPAWGLAVGVDTEKSMKLYRGSRAQTQGIMRKIFLNAVWYQARRAKIPGNDPDPTCTCGKEKEDARHLWWRCERWSGIRSNFSCEALPYDTFSTALRDLGLVLNLPEDQQAPVEQIQRMMNSIFIARFSGL